MTSFIESNNEKHQIILQASCHLSITGLKQTVMKQHDSLLYFTRLTLQQVQGAALCGFLFVSLDCASPASTRVNFGSVVSKANQSCHPCCNHGTVTVVVPIFPFVPQPFNAGFSGGGRGGGSPNADLQMLVQCRQSLFFGPAHCVPGNNFRWIFARFSHLTGSEMHPEKQVLSMTGNHNLPSQVLARKNHTNYYAHLIFF